MLTLDRKIPPKLYAIKNIKVPAADVSTLPNGSRLLVINEGDVEVCRIDLIFNAGSRYQNTKLEASAAMSLLPEGTSRFSSQQISEHFDFWGSFISSTADRDFGRISVYSLTKFLPQTLEMMEEVVKNPSFPKPELDLWCNRGKQSLVVELDKTSTLARMEFFKNIFGSEHPYGTFALPTDYINVDREGVVSFYRENLGSTDATIVLSGRVSTKEIALVEKHFGTKKWGQTNPKRIDTLINGINSRGHFFVEKSNAVQSAIRIGKELFTRSHPDYPRIIVVNTILGGYFGSRLMKNLREDKAFTYGVNSFVSSYRDRGFFVIATEVGSKYTQQALDAIRFELNRLSNEIISEEELNTVKSFLLGEIVRNFNGPFQSADAMINLLLYNNSDFSHFQSVIDTINCITPAEIMELAGKWLNYDSMVECVAGSANPFPY